MSTTPTKRQLARERARRVAERTPAVPLYNESGAKIYSLTEAGLTLVREMAAAGDVQALIAARLKLPLRTFKRLLGNSEDRNDTRAAYEAGRAEHEQDIRDKILAHGEKSFVPLLFYAKAQLAWSDAPQAAQQTNNVQIISLPAPLDRATYFRTLGLVDPSAVAKDVTASVEVTALPAPTPSPTTESESSQTKGE